MDENERIDQEIVRVLEENKKSFENPYSTVLFESEKAREFMKGYFIGGIVGAVVVGGLVWLAGVL